MQSIQPITHRGRTVAVPGTQRFWLAEDLHQLPADHPEVVWAVWMALCARDVLRGQLPGPYSDCAARAYAAAALIPAELLERGAPAGDQRLAHSLGVPIDELRAARTHHAARLAAH